MYLVELKGSTSPFLVIPLCRVVLPSELIVRLRRLALSNSEDLVDLADISFLLLPQRGEDLLVELFLRKVSERRAKRGG